MAEIVRSHAFPFGLEKHEYIADYLSFSIAANMTVPLVITYLIDKFELSYFEMTCAKILLRCLILIRFVH